MKAIGMPPSDTRVRQMNHAQWLWCYINIQKDKDEEERDWKYRLTYLGSYTDPERARSVVEEEQAREAYENSNSSKSSKYKKTGSIQNTGFDIEGQAAFLGYDPSSGLTPEEFIEQYYSKKKSDEIDIVNADFDDLLNSGEFVEINDNGGYVGNRFESEDDFFDRVMQLEEMAANSFEQVVSEEEIKEDNIVDQLLHVETENKKSSEVKKRDINLDDIDEEEFKRILKERGLTEEDLDVIESDDE